MTTSIHADSQQPAIHSIHEFVFSVPDLAEAERFYQAFGLDVRREGDTSDELALYTYGHPHRWGRIVRGAHKRLLWLTFGIFERDMKAFSHKLHALDLLLDAPRAAQSERGLWFMGPDDVPIQLVVAEKSTPDTKSVRVFPPETAPHGRAPCRSHVQPVRPDRLSHLLLFTCDVDATRRFYEDVLGLRLSDHSGSIIAFLHGAHGSDHHLVALAKSNGGGLHHSSWNVNALDEVALGAEQMARAGHAAGWGLGRHVLGSNYFHYVRDPWGSYAEYSFDIDFIPAGLEWPAGDYPPEDSLYVWGPAVPDDFVVNYE